MKSSLETNIDEIAFNEIKQQLDAFLEFQELAQEILHRLLETFEIKADEVREFFYSILEPTCFLFN
ncbi:hypothetical protein WV34_03940 [Bacillus amyloliquefaciens]|nr:hypothetical protein WV34_03940 [Bacillus amyloliquefaciens]